MFSIKITDEILKTAKDFGFSYVEEPGLDPVWMEPNIFFIHDETGIKIKKMTLDDLLMIFKTVEECFHEMRALAIAASNMEQSKT